jgi:hypothetical protein
MHEWFDKFEPGYLGSNTALRNDEAKKFRSAVDKMKKEDIEKIPAFEDVETRIGHFFDWHNNTHAYTGQGMDGKIPSQVMAEHPYERREIPDNYKKYLFTMRYIKTVQRNGVLLDGAWYYTPEMLGITGQRVEVRRGLDDAGTVHIFSLSDKRPLFDATCLEFSGNVQEDIPKKDRLNKEKNALLKKYNKKKAEYDKESINTPAENHALETMQQTQLKVINGESVIVDEGHPTLHLTLVKPDAPPPPKRKLKGILDD